MKVINDVLAKAEAEEFERLGSSYKVTTYWLSGSNFSALLIHLTVWLSCFKIIF